MKKDGIGIQGDSPKEMVELKGQLRDIDERTKKLYENVEKIFHFTLWTVWIGIISLLITVILFLADSFDKKATSYNVLLNEIYELQDKNGVNYYER